MYGAEPVPRDWMATPACDDATLIVESLRVPERFGALFDRHASSIHRYVARRLGPDVADDIVAETFLRAFRGRDRYDKARPGAGPWLYGIATNLIGRHRRDEVRFFRAIARTGLDPAAESFTEAATDRLAASAVRRHLADAVAGLSRAQRDVLLLTASGLGYEEVADALAARPRAASRAATRPVRPPTAPTRACGHCRSPPGACSLTSRRSQARAA